MSDIGRAHSGFADLLGYKLTDRGVGFAEVSLKIGPQHLNRVSSPHGGLLTTLLDSAAGFAAAFVEGPETTRSLVTLSINTIFIGRARVGDTIVAQGRWLGGGKTIAYASAEALVNGKAIARADATFRYIGD